MTQNKKSTEFNAALSMSDDVGLTTNNSASDENYSIASPIYSKLTVKKVLMLTIKLQCNLRS